MIGIVKQAVVAAGGPKSLARQIGVKHQTFYSWKRVPAERVLEVERATGISRHVLRPDIYGPAPQEAA